MEIRIAKTHDTVLMREFSLGDFPSPDEFFI
jgi:hypothetical protein